MNEGRQDVNTVQEGRSEKLGSEGWQRQAIEVPGATKLKKELLCHNFLFSIKYGKEKTKRNKGF